MPKLTQRQTLVLFFTCGLILGKLSIYGGVGILLAMVFILLVDRD